MSLHLFDTLLDAEMYAANTVKNVVARDRHPLIKDLVYYEKNAKGDIVVAIWYVYDEMGHKYGVSDFKVNESSRGRDTALIEKYMDSLDKFKTAIEIASDIQTIHGIPHSFTKWVIVNMSHRNELTISTCKVNNCLMYKKR